jgi:hemerythrin-like domain-containing protein
MSLVDIRRTEKRIASLEGHVDQLREAIGNLERRFADFERSFADQLHEGLCNLERRFAELQREHMDAHQNPMFIDDEVTSSEENEGVLGNSGIIGRGRNAKNE